MPTFDDEKTIREVWQSVTASPAATSFARACYKSVIFAPLGWLALLPVFSKRILGFLPGMGGLAVRYRLTNYRLIVGTGPRCTVKQEVPLADIHDVKVISDGNSDMFVAGTLEVKDADGRVLMSLTGVPEPESMRNSILQSAYAWGPLARA